MLVPAIKQNPLTSIIAQSLLSMLQNKFSSDRASEEADKQRDYQTTMANTRLEEGRLAQENANAEAEKNRQARLQQSKLRAPQPMETEALVDIEQARAENLAKAEENRIRHAKPAAKDPFKEQKAKLVNEGLALKNKGLRKKIDEPAKGKAPPDPRMELANTAAEIGRLTAKFGSPDIAWKNISKEMREGYRVKLVEQVNKLSPQDKAAVLAAWTKRGKVDDARVYLDSITEALGRLGGAQ